MARTIGITVMPEWIQCEGIEPLLDRLERAGATAVATSPYVMAPSAEGSGGREPPADGEAGKVRLLDRELWGRRELWVTTAPSWVPDPAFYAGLPYRPAEPTELTRTEGPLLQAFIAAAKARGLSVHLQVQAAIPPGYRVQFGGPLPADRPLLPDGTEAEGRIDRNGSLASAAIVGYGAALLADLARAYPGIDAIRVDWPEYPPYSFDSLFLDFSVPAMAEAQRRGFDTARMRGDAQRLRLLLLREGGGRTLLRAALAGPEALAAEARALADRLPGVRDLLAFKADLVEALLRAFRAALPASIGLVPQSFPPPWSLASGFDHGRMAGLVQGMTVKLYTMHWPMMLRDYALALRRGHPDLDPGTIARAVVALLSTGDPLPASIEDLRYPEPEEAHPAGAAAQRDKIGAVRAAVAGRCPVWAQVHGYGPVEDAARRFAIGLESSPDGIWVNRWGYLSDAKLERLGALARQPAA